MTEKRFTLVDIGFVRDNGKLIGMKDIVAIMNNLHEENKQLKLQNKQYSMMVNANSDLNDEIYQQLKKTEKNYKSLLKENEQLKKEIGNLEHTKEFCAECCERLEKENEQLKSAIRKVQRAYAQLWMHKYK